MNKIKKIILKRKWFKIIVKLKGFKNGKWKYEKELKAKVFFKQKQYLIYLVFIYSNLNSWIISPSLILFSQIFLNLKIGFALTVNILFVSLKLSYFL